MARDNEDRIVELQNRVDDMNLEVVKQRREIQEYKGKEKNSLEQIGAVSVINHDYSYIFFSSCYA